MKKLILRIKKWYCGISNKKHHIELITAVLSVPMMLTVILVNYNNIKSQKNKTPIENTTPIQVVITGGANSSTIKTSTISSSKPECQKDIGPIQILSPQEGEIVSTDNLCINISTDPKYCPVTWSYKIGEDNWSDFNNNDICLYNLSNGNKQLTIRIKSSAIDKTITLERNFIYKNTTPSNTPTPTLTPTLSPTP